MEHALLILDLDETIIWATEEDTSEGFDFWAFEYRIRKRPHLDAFLRDVARWYHLAVWSSSGDEYARMVVEHVFRGEIPIRFVWARSRCTRRLSEITGEVYFVKDLKKVKRQGFDLARVLLIDDSPEKVERNYGNHLRLRVYEGQSDDRELLDVLPFLKWLKDQEDFRKIEKRQWRKAAHSVRLEGNTF